MNEIMDSTTHDAERLKELQALPLERKIQITQNRIQEFYQHFDGRVYVSFSRGKDSTVLALLARQLYPDIPLVYVNTGLEHTSVQKFVSTWDNVTKLYPTMAFPEVISTYGYPLISKEVAEAIYYARRIAGAESKKKTEQLGKRDARRNIPQCQLAPAETERRRGDLLGRKRTESGEYYAQTDVRDGGTSKRLLWKMANSTGGGADPERRCL